MRAIVIYANCEGQTERIAVRIAQGLANAHIPSDTYNVSRQPADEIALDAYDAAVIGSSLQRGQCDPRIAWLMGTHRELLSLIPSAFFSVRIGGADQRAQQSEAEWRTAELLRELDYNPPLRASFSGMPQTPCSWLRKQMLHWMHGKATGDEASELPGDAPDWQAVDEFAARVARFIRSCELPKPTQPILLSASEPFDFSATRCRDLAEH
ncbi:MAG: flavodoxin domain-containing protein [Planctomycetaceae bacterium]